MIGNLTEVDALGLLHRAGALRDIARDKDLMLGSADRAVLDAAAGVLVTIVRRSMLDALRRFPAPAKKLQPPKKAKRRR